MMKLPFCKRELRSTLSHRRLLAIFDDVASLAWISTEHCNLYQLAEPLNCAVHCAGMPHFRFHVINDIDAPDDEGQDLANLAAAHLKAIEYARDLASAAVRLGRIDLKHRIDIEDEDGRVLMTVTFADAIEISR